MWKFLEYKGANGELPVSNWYAELSPKDRARADRFVNAARELEKLGPDFAKHRELLKARWWGVNKVPHRIFCYIPSAGCVTFLCGFTHKDQRYNPRNAYDVAVKRRKEIEEKKAETDELSF